MSSICRPTRRLQEGFHHDDRCWCSHCSLGWMDILFHESTGNHKNSSQKLKDFNGLGKRRRWIHVESFQCEFHPFGSFSFSRFSVSFSPDQVVLPGKIIPFRYEILCRFDTTPQHYQRLLRIQHSNAFCDAPFLLLVKLSNELCQIKTIEISLVRLAVVRCTCADGV